MALPTTRTNSLAVTSACDVGTHRMTGGWLQHKNRVNGEALRGTQNDWWGTYRLTGGSWLIGEQHVHMFKRECA